jgi:hypothetical protein
METNIKGGKVIGILYYLNVFCRLSKETRQQANKTKQIQ